MWTKAKKNSSIEICFLYWSWFSDAINTCKETKKKETNFFLQIKVEEKMAIKRASSFCEMKNHDF